MELNDTLIIPILVGLVEIAKKVGLSGKYSSILSLLLGIGLSLLLKGLSLEAGIQGLVFGLSASGLYSGGKAMVKKSN